MKDWWRKCPECGRKGKATGTKHATDSFSVRYYRCLCGHSWVFKFTPPKPVQEPAAKQA